MQKWSLRVFILIAIVLLTACSKTYSRIDKEHSLVMTLNIKDMTISFIDLPGREKIADWQMDKPYEGGFVLPDADTLLLYGRELAAVDLFSLAKGKKIASWDTGKGIASGVFLENGDTIVFADQEQNKIRFFSLDGKEQAAVPADENPSFIYKNVSGSSIYIISLRSESLTEIDMETREKTNHFSIHPSASGVFYNHRVKKDELWIGGHGSGAKGQQEIFVYDPGTGKVVKDITAPLMPVDFAASNEAVYAISHGSNTLHKISYEGKVIDSVQVGANPFKVEFFKDFLIVAAYDSNDIHFINQHTLQIEKTVPVGKGPFQIILRERQKQ